MGSEQGEGGYWGMDNELAEAFARLNPPLSGRCWKCLWVVMRLTDGWQRSEAQIPYSEISKRTGGLARSHVSTAMRDLEDRQIIERVEVKSRHVTLSRTSKVITWRFQRNYELWKALPKTVCVTETSNTSVTETGNNAEKTLHDKSAGSQDVVTGTILAKDIPPKDISNTIVLGPPKDLQLEIQEKGQKAKPKPKADPRINHWLKWFAKRWEQVQGKPYTVAWAKEGKSVQRLLKVHSPEDLQLHAESFLLSDDEFINRAGFTIPIFESQINKIVGDKTNAPRTGRRFKSAETQRGKFDKKPRTTNQDRA